MRNPTREETSRYRELRDELEDYKDKLERLRQVMASLQKLEDEAEIVYKELDLEALKLRVKCEAPKGFMLDNEQLKFYANMTDGTRKYIEDA